MVAVLITTLSSRSGSSSSINWVWRTGAGKHWSWRAKCIDMFCYLSMCWSLLICSCIYLFLYLPIHQWFLICKSLMRTYTQSHTYNIYSCLFSYIYRILSTGTVGCGMVGCGMVVFEDSLGDGQEIVTWSAQGCPATRKSSCSGGKSSLNDGSSIARLGCWCAWWIFYWLLLFLFPAASLAEKRIVNCAFLGPRHDLRLFLLAFSAQSPLGSPTISIGVSGLSKFSPFRLAFPRQTLQRNHTNQIRSNRSALYLLGTSIYIMCLFMLTIYDQFISVLDLFRLIDLDLIYKSISLSLSIGVRSPCPSCAKKRETGTNKSVEAPRARSPYGWNMLKSPLTAGICRKNGGIHWIYTFW